MLEELPAAAYSAPNLLPQSGSAVGRVAPPPVWEGRVELQDETVVEGVFCGLRPHGLAAVTEPGGAAYAAEYDGERTFAEGPVPVRKQASLRRRRK